MDKKEVREAIQAGETALTNIEKAREKLDSANKWCYNIAGTKEERSKRRSETAEPDMRPSE